jgi:DNA-binding NarL/FixJ family response regulator
MATVTIDRTGMKERVKRLTPRQKQVMRLVSLGCNVEEIACILQLAVSTVDNHKAAAMKTLGTDKATTMTRIAIATRVSPLEDCLTTTERRRSGRKNDGWN